MLYLGIQMWEGGREGKESAVALKEDGISTEGAILLV